MALRIDQIVAPDIEGYSKRKGLKKYFLKTKVETHKENGDIIVTQKENFQSKLAINDSINATKKVVVPLVLGFMMLFWTKRMEYMFPIAVSSLATDEINGGTSNSGGDLSYTHTCTGSSLGLVACMMSVNNSFATIKYNNVALTQGAGIANGAGHTYIGYLIAPTTGAHTLAWTGTTGQRNGMMSISFSGADQTTLIGNTNADQGTSSVSLSITIQSANNYTVEAQGVYSGGSSITENSSQTKIANTQAQTNYRGVGAYKQHSSAGATTLSSNADGGTFQVAAVEILAGIVNLDISVNDAITVAENISNNTVNRINIFDSISVAESVGFEFVFSVNVFDSITLNETVLTELVNNINVFDAITVTENTTALLPFLFANVNDSITVAEDITTEFVHNINVFDAITVNESVSVLLPFLGISVFETISVAEYTLLIEETLWQNRSQVSASWTNRTQPNSTWTNRPQAPSGGDW